MSCYHRPFTVYKNKYIQPIHVGRANCDHMVSQGLLTEETKKWFYSTMPGDDTGDNISLKNGNYCELTAVYWAWKNLEQLKDPDYVGLMHYRRVFNFDNQTGKVYSPTKKSIMDSVRNYDIILTAPKKIYSVTTKKEYTNVKDYFDVNFGSHYTDIMKNVLLDSYPEMINAYEKVLLHKKTISWYNIFIMRRDIFCEYCQWLFTFLSKIDEICIKEGIDTSNSRLMGYYGEILLNVYVEYISSLKPHLKINYVVDKRLPQVNEKLITSKGLEHFAYEFVKNSEHIDDYRNIYRLYTIKKLCRHVSRKKTEYKKVHSITFRKSAPFGGAGGGSAVQSCVQAILGNHYRNLKLKYTYLEDNPYSYGHLPLWDLFGAAYFAYVKTKDEHDAVYITHDYGTAYGLYLMGKRYALVSHIQGSRVEEKTNFAEKMSWMDIKIIKYCEKKAMENAAYLCFPSYGAYEYFINSKFTDVNPKKITLGPILYNTLYAYPKAEPIEKIIKKPEFLTFLSIGQMTVAKGMDQNLKFIETILDKAPNKKIRWILVGEGPLLSMMFEKLISLTKRYSNFIFSYKGKCSYPQIQELQNIADVYLMLQKISIFDLATLENMNKSNAIVLSKVGGNIEFNKLDNIIFFDGDYHKTVDKLLSANLAEYGKRNKTVYDTFFSNKVFKNNYGQLIDKLAEISFESIVLDEINNIHLEIDSLSKSIRSLSNQYSKDEECEKEFTVISKRLDDISHDIDLKPHLEELWKDYGASTEFMNVLSTMSKDRLCWERVHHKIWLMYLSVLIEKKEYAYAETILNKYVRYHGLKDIFRYLPVACFVDEIFQSTSLIIHKSASVFRIMEKNRKNNLFLNSLYGKSVAIVGNGPSEIGKKLGSEIDSHDIVIRFNNYDTVGFEEDYGEKTSIWIRGSGSSDVINRTDVSKYDMIVLEGDYWHYPIIPVGHPDVLYEYIENDIDLTYFDFETHRSLKDASGIFFPTTGLVTIWAIHRIRGSLKKLDIYGFAFRNNQKENVSTHYFNDRSKEVAVEKTKVHSLDKESEFIIKLLSDVNKH